MLPFHQVHWYLYFLSHKYVSLEKRERKDTTYGAPIHYSRIQFTDSSKDGPLKIAHLNEQPMRSSSLVAWKSVLAPPPRNGILPKDLASTINMVNLECHKTDQLQPLNMLRGLHVVDCSSHVELPSGFPCVPMASSGTPPGFFPCRRLHSLLVLEHFLLQRWWRFHIFCSCSQANSPRSLDEGSYPPPPTTRQGRVFGYERDPGRFSKGSGKVMRGHGQKREKLQQLRLKDNKYYLVLHVYV